MQHRDCRDTVELVYRRASKPLKDDLLLAKDIFRHTAWYTAARDGNKEILE